MEIKAVSRIAARLDDVDGKRSFLKSLLSAAHFDPWNWITVEGRELCTRLCREKGVPMKHMDDAENFYLWPQYLPLETMIPKRGVPSLADLCAICVVRNVPASKVVGADVPWDVFELILCASERLQMERSPPFHHTLSPHTNANANDK